MLPGWKKLLQQAFTETELPVNSTGRCGLLQIHRFIYRALAAAGIENRSPFNLWQILHIRYQSRGIPEQVRARCLLKLQALQRPALNYSHTGSLIISLTLIAVLPLLISPRTANTFLTAPLNSSILVYRIQPMADLDDQEVRLPTTADYHLDGVSPLAHHILIDATNNLASNDWINQQPDAHYSLQLLSASQPESLQRFCRQHRICAKSAFYRSSVNGQTLYRLLYGVFPTNKSAQTASLKLTSALRKQSPWARQFGQIKQEIRQN